MKTIPSLVLVLLSVNLCFGQNTIEIQIDHGGLHCPYLGPRFHDRFAEHSSVDSVNVDTKNSVGTLYLADEQTISDEEITDIIVHKVGYPQPEIKAIIRDGE